MGKIGIKKCIDAETFSEYLRGFGIEKGMILDHFRLKSISVKHITIERYHVYEYGITMKWERLNANADADALLDELERHTEGAKTIYTSYGNPYRCDFGEGWDVEEGRRTLTILTTGHCHRIKKN